MKKSRLILLFVFFLFLVGCSGVDQNEFDSVKNELEQTQNSLSQASEQIEHLQSELKATQDNLTSTQSDLEKSRSDYNILSKEYESYKEEMAPFEELSAEEAEARKIAAQKEIEAAKAEEEAKAAEEAAERERKEKLGYDTGITYNQLARTPDDYEGDKVKFKGKVVQLIDGGKSIQIRLAINSDYDHIILCTYDSSIVSSRVLEDDIITVYGTSAELISYQSTFGGTITIPAVLVDKIDQ